MANNEIVAVKILNLEAQIAPLEDIVHEAQTMKVGQQQGVALLYSFCIYSQPPSNILPAVAPSYGSLAA